MNKSMYVLAIILVVGWIVGFFGTSIGDIIHLLLVMALIAVLIADYQGQQFLKNILSRLK